MNKYKIYRQDNYIVIVNTSNSDTQYGFVKEVFIDKSNNNTANYRVFNVRDFNDGTIINISQFLKEDGSAYTQSEFEDFYKKNTGNFNGGGSSPSIEEAPNDGLQYGRQNESWTQITGSGTPQDLQSVLDNGSIGNVNKPITISGGFYGQLLFEDGTGSGNGITLQTNGGSRLSLQANSGGSILLSPTTGVQVQHSTKINLSSNGNSIVLGRDGDNALTLDSNLIVIKGGLTTLNLEGTSENNVFSFPEKPAGEYTLMVQEDIAPEINIIDDGDFTIPDGSRTRIITLTDDAPQNITLPAISDAVRAIYFITNESSDGVSTVNILTKTGTNDIFDAGMLVNDKEVPYGIPVRIINDGRNFKIL